MYLYFYKEKAYDFDNFSNYIIVSYERYLSPYAHKTTNSVRGVSYSAYIGR